MKKIVYLFVILCVSLLFSCSQMAGGSGMYFIQQQKTSEKDAGIGGPTVEWGEDEDDDSVNSLLPTPPAAGEDVIITMFSVLQPDGVIFPGAESLLAGKLGGSDVSYTGYAYDTSKYNIWKLIAKFSGANVPEMWYSGDVSWSSISGSTWETYKGANSSAGPNSITDMVYMRSVGVNPFFATDSSYNEALYYLYEGDKTEYKTAKIMERFHFYRFTGKGGGVAALDNYLVAVDTYTKLVFSFAKPTKWGSLLGNAVPLEWGPVDLVSTGPGGVKYKFYEYDPAGYITEDGVFHMTTDYKNNLSSANYDPVFTGKSPYLGEIVLKGGEGGGITSSGGADEKGYSVSGTLTVKAKSIKNVSMSDSWGDHGNADGTDKPEFIYSVRSRAYSGFEAGEWNVMSSYKPEDTDMMPASAKTIQKGQTLALGGGKQYTFENIEDGLTLELDSRIIEIDIRGNDNITDYETPIVFLGYDRYSQKWQPTIDNATYLRAPPQYDQNFQVGLGETKDFVVTLATGHNETIELTYEISWDSESFTEQGRIFSAQTRNVGADDSYTFTGSNGEYKVDYLDFNEVSSKEEKVLNFEITLANLDNVTPIIVYQTKNNTTSGFIKNVTLNEDPGFGILTEKSSVLQVELTLNSNSGANQKGTLTLEFKDESGLSVYDTAKSPKTITFEISRDVFQPTDTGNFVVSNMKLKNLNLMDIGGDQPKGGYDEPEFTWDVKTQHNQNNWKLYASNASVNYKNYPVIKPDNSVSISGGTTHNIFEPREGQQKIYLSAEIIEKDVLAGNDDDIVISHGQPLIRFDYIPFTDSWKIGGTTSYYFTDGKDRQWQLKKVEMAELERGKKQTVTVSLSGYVHDTIWPTEEGFLEWFTSVIAGPTTAGWGDMELTFDVEWRDE